MIRIVPIFLFFTFLSGLSWGQSAEPSVINSAGGQGESASMSIVWSLGEVVTETFRSEDKVLTQGLLQPEIIVTMVEDFDTGVSVDVFPNPAREWLTIRAENFTGEELQFTLLDVSGNIVKRGYINGEAEKSLRVSDLSPGIYFLRIISGTDNIKAFKVVKQ